MPTTRCVWLRAPAPALVTAVTTIVAIGISDGDSRCQRCGSPLVIGDDDERPARLHGPAVAPVIFAGAVDLTTWTLTENPRGARSFFDDLQGRLGAASRRLPHHRS